MALVCKISLLGRDGCEVIIISLLFNVTLTCYSYVNLSPNYLFYLFSTTGFGDITPRNVNEMIMGIVAVFSGAFILSIILSHFTAGMASLSKAHREYIYQVKLLVVSIANYFSPH